MKFWTTLGVLLLAVGALALRLPQRDERPMHTDEAVHAVKFLGLWERGVYRYDPDEYHGPSLYYATLPLAWLSGAHRAAELSEKTLRLTPVLFGVGLVLLVLLARDGLGGVAVLGAALLTAVSPAMVFYSRYFIHETLLVFFSLLFLAALWRYHQSPGWGWAILAGGALGGLHATKETFVFVVVASAAGWGIARLWGRLREGVWPAVLLRRDHLLVLLGAALLVSTTLFTSFFTNGEGPIDAWRTYLPWLERAEGQSPHVQSWSYYFGLLLCTRRGQGPLWTEAFVLALALVGLVSAFLRPKGDAAVRDPFLGRWLGGYTVFLTAVYVAIPYKTPWCLLGFLHGWILLAGIGVAEVVRWGRHWTWRGTVAALVLLGATHLGLQAYRASYPYADSQRNPYVYAHTLRNTLDLVDIVDELVHSGPEGLNTVVQVMARGGDYWHLPWYLRHCHRVGWYAEVPPDAAAPVLIASPEFAPALEAKLGQTHEALGYYGLRPGVFLQLHAERHLWEAFLKAREQSNRASP